jgi:hypothetical protein
MLLFLFLVLITFFIYELLFYNFYNTFLVFYYYIYVYINIYLYF